MLKRFKFLALFFIIVGMLLLGNDSAEANGGFNIRNNVLIEYTGTDAYVTVPYGVTEIGPKAFYYNSYVRSITLPSTVRKINTAGISGNYSLMELKLNNGLSEIGFMGLADNPNLVTFNFPSSVRVIGASAFAKTPIPGGQIDLRYVTNIGDKAFEFTNFKYINLQSIRSMGVNVFYGSEVVDAVIAGSITKLPNSTFDYSRIKNVTLGQNIKSIGTKAFAATGNITTLKLPSSVNFIDELAFYNSSIQNINLENVVQINQGAFRKSDITYANLSSIKKLEIYVFYESKLTNFKLSNYITEIPMQAFWGANIDVAYIPDSVVTIGQNAFSDNPIRFIALGDKVSNIYSNAFRNTNANFILIPISVGYIEGDPFDNIPVYGYPGTVAQKYANSRNKKFVPVSNKLPEPYYTNSNLTVTNPIGHKYELPKGKMVYATLENNGTVLKFIHGGGLVNAGTHQLSKRNPVLNGWHVIQNKYVRYYVNGRPLVGKQKIGNTTYLFDKYGNKQSGWHVLAGKAYYFNPAQNGGMVTGKRKIGQTTYIFNNQGHKTFGWHVLNGKVYYFNEINGGMWTGMRTINGYNYIFHNSGYRLSNYWHVANGKKYYYNPNMYRNTTQKVGNGIYRFGYNGAVIN